MTLKVLALGGDGIGPEVVDAALRLLDVAASSINLDIDLAEDLLHGAAWQKYEEQDGLMKLRHELDVFACIRHARAWDALLDRTPFRPGRVRGADIVVMRELCGGAMFTQTRGSEANSDGNRRAWDLNEYSSDEIARFARVGFEVARRRRGKVISVDKANVFVAGKLWREVVEEVARAEFADVELNHLFADNASYQMCCQPTAFDVILADNLFGDLLSDQSAAIAGSLGMLPSASLPDLPQAGRVQGSAIYEPVHGSAPDIAGQGISNPVGMILSVAMMLEYSAGESGCARKIEAAVDAALNAGKATRDIGGNLDTAEMTDAVIEQFRLL